MRWIAFLLVLVCIGTVEASHSVNILTPDNDTWFNHTVSVTVNSNATIGANNWTYFIDGVNQGPGGPNRSIVVDQGYHNLTVYADNGTLNESGTVEFTAAYIIVQVFDIETSTNITSGINLKILSEAGTTLISNTTNTSGAEKYQGINYDTYQVQGGGPAGSLYPHIFTYTFAFNQADEYLTLYLPQSTACSFRTFQYVDSFYATPLDQVNVTIYIGTNLLGEFTTDSTGFITVCLVPGLTYTLQGEIDEYVSSNKTDQGNVGSQFVQMVRESLVVATNSPIEIHLYPEETEYFKNDTVMFGMWISDAESALESYKIVYGRSADIVRDDSIVANDKNFRFEVASGTNGGGEYLTCVQTDNCLMINDWKGPVLYVGYYYKRVGQGGVWVVKRIQVTNDLTGVNFWSNYTTDNNPKTQFQAFLSSIGYGPEPDGGIPLAWINFSFIIMVFSAIGAARNGWGVMGAMVAFTGANIVMVTLGLIHWWTILVSVALIVFLGNRFGSVFT